jgi:hypothetical protein
MRPSSVQTSVVLQQTLTCLKEMGVSLEYCAYGYHVTIRPFIGDMA